MSKLAHRDISPMLQKLRNFLLGREHTNALRFEDGLAARTQEAPNLPEGPHHRIFSNYYALRDARRELAPPTRVTYSNLLIGKSNKIMKLPKPGKPYGWDQH
ncbi:NADH dehydrogenase [ubiquinone] 1 alpha subcomplex subunit 7-like [Sabethes cyaneus]|uniref:NADH dehydrogenase [ubiquinone] 1 alpha subcomplex subunit 7-like n=1 Tax=Sabethes cyaneus TaxID=53552 RepID=UPI00221E31CF|nr:NADH dehydrogenase [ubiquinone] 1 alpha subcomplex subunit 7-like [Sabethes cyaneus]